MAIDMGIGKLGNPKLTFKRKYRWTLTVNPYCQQNGSTVPPFFVKVAARPNFDVEELELNFLNDKMWIAGKASWQAVTVTYIDTATEDTRNLYQWIANVYNFADPVNRKQGRALVDYGADIVITMYSGCGDPLEEWILANAWPQTVNFGELDYASSEEATVELTLRYSRVKYQSFCPAFVPTNCCTPCDPNITVP